MDYDQDIFAELEIRPLTKRLINNLMLDLPMEGPLIVDFGLDSANHYRALHAIIFNDADTPELAELADDEAASELAAKSEFHQRVRELDAAYGNGPLLNALVRKYAPEYADIVRFQTDWDTIYGRTNIESDSQE